MSFASELGCGEAALRVLALVSGMPREQRMSRMLLMLQAYVDESFSGGLFVMAGYIAPVQSWLAFSDEWHSLLALGAPHFRTISEFKMQQMAKSERAIEQSKLFYRVIEKHLHRYVSCVVNIEDLNRVHQQVSWPDWLDNVDVLKNEYYTAFDQIIKSLTIYLDELGIDQPVDFIFDENSNHAKCIRGWDIMKKYGHPSIRKWLGASPIFRDSKTTMPLQAADLLAYWMRNSQLNTPLTDPQFRLKLPWDVKSDDMKGVATYCTPEMMRKNFRDAILACSLLRAGLSPDLIPAVVSPKKA